MPIKIIVELNGKQIAMASAANISDLADVSDYWVHVTQRPNPSMDIGLLDEAGVVRAHERNQSVWALVRRIAEFATAK